MNAAMMQKTSDLKMRLEATWNAGDYDKFSRYMEEGAERFYERLNVPKGAALLDVACGSGQLALIAARSGARVTGCDIASNWIQRARERAKAESLAARFDVGDAEALPYDDAQFDVVTSLVGAMFAPDPALVSAELKRVCKPGGRIAMANWTASGFVGQMFRIIARHIAPSGMPSPVLWGDETVVQQRLGTGTTEVATSRTFYHFDYPFSPADVVEFFRVNYGPMCRAFEGLDAMEQAMLRRELTELWAAHNQSNNGRTVVDAEYLEVIATRS